MNRFISHLIVFLGLISFDKVTSILESFGFLNVEERLR